MLDRLRKTWTSPNTVSRAIIMLLLAVVLPMLAALVALSLLWFNSRLADERDTNLDAAWAACRLYENFLRDLGTDEQSVGAALALMKPFSKEQAREQMRIVVRGHPSIGWMCWADVDGVSIVGSDDRCNALPPATKELCDRIRAGEESAVGDLLPAVCATGKPGFIVARGIREKDMLRGIMVSGVDADQLGDLAFGFLGAHQGFISIFDSRGTLVFRQPEVELTWEQRQPESDPLIDQARREGQASGEIRRPSDTERRVAARVRTANGWFTGASRPEGAVIGPLERQTLLILGSAVLVSGLSLGVAYRLGRRISRSTRDLEAHAEAIAGGQLEHRPHPTGLREMAGFGQILNDMADLLGERQEFGKRIEALARFPSEDPNPVLRIDRQGALMYANDSSGPLLDFWSCRASRQLSGQWKETVQRIHSAGQVEQVEIDCPGRLFSCVFTPVAGQDYVNVYAQDVTARRQAEEALRKSAEDLLRSNKDLEQFAYVASHDLQEPLRMVTGYLTLLERRYKSQLDANADEFIAFAVDGADRMSRLINDLLAYSRVNRGKAMEPTDSGAALTQALAGLRTAIAESGAEVVAENLPTVLADPTQMAQLFQNLIGNALKFHSDRPPRIQVSARPNGREWIFAVTDNGIGIEPQYKERIFVIFQRLHTREKYPGTGIGLAICQRIVERHHGRIWVESQPGQGSTFFFTIPQ